MVPENPWSGSDALAECIEETLKIVFKASWS